MDMTCSGPPTRGNDRTTPTPRSRDDSWVDDLFGSVDVGDATEVSELLVPDMGVRRGAACMNIGGY